MSNYTKTTNFATKDSLPSGNPAKIVKGTEINTEFDNIAVASATKLNSSTVSTFGATLIDDANASAARTTLGLGTAATTASTDYATAAQGTTADAALPKIGGAMTGAITTNSTFDGRDVATDGTKLDGIEASADVTDTTNVTAAGALMDSEVTNLAQVKAFDSTDYATAAQGTLAAAALPKSGGAMTGAITTNSTFDGVDIATRDGVLSSTTTTANAALQKAGGTMSGAIAMGTSKITGAGDPTAAQDVATKAYVDANAGGGGDVTLAGDNTFTGDNTFSAELTANGGIALGDNDKATFGAGDDLQIYHDGSNSFIDNGSGSLTIDSGVHLFLKNASGESLATFLANGESQLYYDNALKLATTATGIDVTGAVTADGLQVSAPSGNLTALLDSVAGSSTLQFRTGSGNNSTYINSGTGGSANLRFRTGGAIDRQKIDANGDISFYEDTGSTAKLFWDASAESLGIGDMPSTPKDTALNLRSNSDAHAITIYEPVGASENWQLGVDVDGDLGFYNSGSTTASVTFDDAGSVGIGTSSPTKTLSVAGALQVDSGAANSDVSFVADDGYDVYLGFGTAADRYASYIRKDLGVTKQLSISAETTLSLKTNEAERMRIDSSGKVGIGTSSPKTPLNVVDNNSDNSLPTLGAASGVLSISNAANQYGLLGGVLQSSGDSWLQAQRTDGTATAYNILLNPVGGNVGIGTTSPSALLDVNIDGNTGRFSRSGTQYIEVSASSGGQSILSTSGTNKSLNIGTTDSNQFRLQTNGSSALTIDASQNVGIGTTSPSYPLTVDTGAGTFSVRAKGGSSVTIASDASMTYFADTHEFYNSAGTGEKMRIDSAGKVGIGTASPATTLDVAGSGAEIAIRDTRNASWTIGDTVASLGFYSNDTSGGSGSTPNLARGAIDLVTTSTFGSTHDMVFKTRGDVSTGAVEQLRITSAGNVGIGTNSPSAALDVNGTIEFNGLSGTGAVTVTDILDEDNMASNSATALATQQSIKAYVDANSGGGGGGDITAVTAGTGLTGGGTTGAVTLNVIGGDGITANADDIALDSTVVRTSGTQTISGQKNFNDVIRINNTNAVLRLTAGTSSPATIQFGDSNDFDIGKISYFNANNSMSFTTNAGERARITSTGDFLVGKTAQNATTVGCELDASGFIYATSDLTGYQGINVRNNFSTDSLAGLRTFNGVAQITATSATGGGHSIAMDGGLSGEYARFTSAKRLGIGITAPTQALHVVGNIVATGNITANFSDERLKDFKGTIPDALDKVAQLNGYYYTPNETAQSLGVDNNGVEVGVSAQEVEAVLPEIVTDSVVGKDYKTVMYERLTPLLIEAVKELTQKLEKLELKLTEMEK